MNVQSLKRKRTYLPSCIEVIGLILRKDLEELSQSTLTMEENGIIKELPTIKQQTVRSN